MDRYYPDPKDFEKNKSRFDPIVHLEIEDENAQSESNESDSDEFAPKPDDPNDLLSEGALMRYKVKDLQKIWLRLNPGQNEFVNMIDNCFKEGLECLKAFERWSKHQDLVKYERVLETWDDRVCDEWEPPEEKHLKIDDWLQNEVLYQEQSLYVRKRMSSAFHKVEKYMINFHVYLEKIWDNNNIDFTIPLNEKFKNPVEFLPLLLHRFKDQEDEFEDMLPSDKELGLLMVNFYTVKSNMIPNPKEKFEILRKTIPPQVRRWIEDSKVWIET